MSAHDQADPRVLDADDTDNRGVRPGGRDARLLTGLYRLGWASMLANGLLIVTGGLVRLTGSGLGCPTWPRCTDSSWTNTPEMGIHGYIEFGNRTLTFVLTAIAVATFVWGWRLRKQYPRLFALTVALLAGIPLQAVIGGITVRMQLNPWIVGIHFILSAVLVALATLLVERTTRARAGRPVSTVGGPARAGLWGLAAGSALLLYLGTLVTGAGPHSGDSGDVARHEFDIEMLAKAHAWVAIAVTLLVVALLVGVPRLAQRAAQPGEASETGGVAGLPAVPGPAAMKRLTVLLLVLLAQGALGYYQYFAGVPVVPVAIHLFGAAAIAALATSAVERGLRG